MMAVMEWLIFFTGGVFMHVFVWLKHIQFIIYKIPYKLKYYATSSLPILMHITIATELFTHVAINK